MSWLSRDGDEFSAKQSPEDAGDRSGRSIRKLDLPPLNQSSSAANPELDQNIAEQSKQSKGGQRMPGAADNGRPSSTNGANGSRRDNGSQNLGVFAEDLGLFPEGESRNGSSQSQVMPTVSGTAGRRSQPDNGSGSTPLNGTPPSPGMSPLSGTPPTPTGPDMSGPNTGMNGSIARTPGMGSAAVDAASIPNFNRTAQGGALPGATSNVSTNPAAPMSEYERQTASRDVGFEDLWTGSPEAGPARNEMGAQRSEMGAQMGRNPRDLRLELAPRVESKSRRVPQYVLGGLAALAALGVLYFGFLKGDGTDTVTDVADGTEAVVQDNGAEDDLAGLPESNAADTDDPIVDDGAMGDAAIEGEAVPAAPTILEGTPTLSLAGAESGPLETEVEYPLQLSPVPENSTYLVVVDGREQSEPLDYLPNLFFPSGRHTVTVTVTSGETSAVSTSVEIYVLEPSLEATTRANLNSVNIVSEGWDQALVRFDEFRAAGHAQLLLSPSDPYPSLAPGFWNIYVPGFADRAAAVEYCESKGLAVPDQCFPTPFDPAAPAN